MKTFYLLILLIAVCFSCSEDETGKSDEPVVDVTFGVNVPSLNLVYEVTNMTGKVGEVPDGFTHAFGGVGTIQFVESSGKYIINAEFEGDKIHTTKFTVPAGTYNVSIFFDNGDCKATTYFPFTAFGDNIEITPSTTSINLQGGTEYGLVLVKNQYLVAVGSLTSPVFNGDSDGGITSGGECSKGDGFTELKEDFYYLYLHSSIDNGTLNIYYENTDPSVEFNKIMTTLDIEEAKIYKFIITDTSTSDANLNFDLNSIWTIEEFEFGLM